MISPGHPYFRSLSALHTLHHARHHPISRRYSAFYSVSTTCLTRFAHVDCISPPLSAWPVFLLASSFSLPSTHNCLFHLFCHCLQTTAKTLPHCLSTASPPPARLHSFLLAFFGQGPAMQCPRYLS